MQAENCDVAQVSNTNVVIQNNVDNVSHRADHLNLKGNKNGNGTKLGNMSVPYDIRHTITGDWHSKMQITQLSDLTMINNAIPINKIIYLFGVLHRF